jgi:tryptophanyl-tRNA synthetase
LGRQRDIGRSTIEMVLDWLAIGLDPERCTIFQQSAVVAHAELYVLLGMLTPVPWLERNPTYKEQQQQLDGRDLSTFGFLGYPVLQAADVMIYKASAVPVGIDQAPHIELAREIARRFNATYREIFPEPQTLLTETPKIVGTDGRKMSKSYGNAVYLTEDPAEIDRKLSRMITDPRRARRTDPGEPNDCPAYTSLHRIYCTPEELAWAAQGCRTAGIGCLECKKVMIKHVLTSSAVPERRARLGPADAQAVLDAGNRRAREIAEATMREVRDAMGLGNP